MKKVLRKNIKRVVAGGLIASTLAANSFGNVTAHAETLYTQGIVSTQAVADQNGFVIENGELTKYEGSATQVTIPSSVSVIGREAFSGCTTIKSVTLPSTVTTIRYSAFSGCTNLESITIPGSVENIFDCAFQNCSSLKSITVPNANAFIGNGVFDGCSNLVSISLPSSIGAIGNHTFMGCSSLTSISLPDTVKTICDGAFFGCSSLKSINIPNQITEIRGATFYNCSSLTSITIPDTVTLIDDYAFGGCRNLSRISIPASVTSMGKRVFEDCSNLVVDTPNYSYAYQYCIENGHLLAGVITPTPIPTSVPTSTPTVRPTSTPTARPTSTPTARPTSTPTARPTSTPTARPTSTPTARPTSTPTAKPMSTPTAKPTSKPTSTPTAKPTSKPTSTPTAKPTSKPTSTPTAKPTSTPTAKPTSTPTATPTQAPKTCTVTFDAQGGVVGTDVKQVTNGEKYGMLPASIKQGYNFVGWYTDPSYGTKVTEDTIVSEMGNHTLYAHWMRTYESIGLESLSYQFSNIRSSFQYGAEYKIPLDVYEAIFGKTIKAYRLFENSSKWGGNCFGMVATSILFNVLSNDVDITDYNEEATCVADCLPEQKEKDTGISLTRFIEMMHVAQKDSLVQQSIIENQNDLNGLCQAVTDTMEQKGDPIIIALYGPEGGHAVVGYKLTGNKLYIYDPNMPSVSRYITLEKNTKGDYVSWEYLMNDTYSWGAGKEKCWISYVPYKAYYEVWSKRGSASESEQNLMHLNLDNAQIYDSNEMLVAEYCNGKLQNNTDQVYEQVKMDLGEQDDNGTHSIYLPAGTYTVKNTDGKQKEFTVSMVNVNLGATVKTSAEQVEISVEDAQNKNDVNIDAKKGQNYEISLDSSFEYDNQNVTLEGTGQGDTINVSQSKGNVKFYGVDSKLYINGEEVEYATIKAFANPGGTISKEGIIGVTKGESQTFTIQPDEGYEIADVLVDGKSRGAVSSYTFENVQENHSIIASFKEKKAASPESVIKKGLLVTVGDFQYKVTKVSDTNGTVALVKSKKTKRTSVVIPDKISIGGKKYKVTAVSDNVFANHKKLKSVTIGKNVTTIGKKAFYGDSNLKTITIKSQALKTVGAKAFSGTYKKAVVKVAKAKLNAYKKLLAKKGLNKMVVYKKM